MAKVKHEGNGVYSFFCPGCGHDHVFYTGKNYEPKVRWSFNGNVNAPTFGPSLLNRWGKQADPHWKEPTEIEAPVNGWSGRCHLFVKDGLINYCNDCTHSYNGKKNVPMKDIDEPEVNAMQN